MSRLTAAAEPEGSALVSCSSVNSDGCEQDGQDLDILPSAQFIRRRASCQFAGRKLPAGSGATSLAGLPFLVGERTGRKRKGAFEGASTLAGQRSLGSIRASFFCSILAVANSKGAACLHVSTDRRVYEISTQDSQQKA